MPSDRTPPPPVSPTASFGDFLSFEDYMLLAEHNMAKGEITHEWRQTNDRLLEEVFGNALRGFLPALREEGRLERIRGGEGHRIDFLAAWNEMVESGLEGRDADHQRWAWRDLTGTFAHRFVLDATYPVGKAREEGSL